MTLAKKSKILFRIFLIVVGLFALIQNPLLGIMALGAVLTQGIMGPGSGKVGGVIMSNWKAINYIRGYAVPSNPRTLDQVAQRTKFKTIIQFAQKLMTSVIPQAWDPFYDRMSGFNAFVKQNWDDFKLTSQPTTNTIMAKGTLEGIIISSAAYNSSTGLIGVIWNPDIFGNGLSTDLMFFVIADKSSNNIFFQGSSDAKREDGMKIDITIPSDLTATDLIIYIFTFRGTGLDYLQSNSSAQICEAN